MDVTEIFLRRREQENQQAGRQGRVWTNIPQKKTFSMSLKLDAAQVDREAVLDLGSDPRHPH